MCVCVCVCRSRFSLSLSLSLISQASLPFFYAGTINQDDVDRLYFVDDVDEAYKLIRENLIHATVSKGVPLMHSSLPVTPTNSTDSLPGLSIDKLKV